MFFRETPLFKTDGHSNYRIPSIVSTSDGTIFAFCNNRINSLADHAEETGLVFSRKKPCQDWEPIKIIAQNTGWTLYIGSAVYDAMTNCIMCTARRRLAMDEFGTFTDEEVLQNAEKERLRAEAEGLLTGEIIFSSTDGGETWTEAPLIICERPFITNNGQTIAIGGFCHGSAHGIQLRRGRHKGRLLCPSRIMTGRYDNWDDAIKCCYNNSIYSDDHGAIWHASSPVQQGTGEGTLIETENGDILYNSRGMHRNGRRYLALSHDGGETYSGFATDDFLREDIAIGCNASLIRIECAGLLKNHNSITLFANPLSHRRENMSVCISFDDGRTWPRVRTIWEKAAAYSSMEYDPISGHFFLLYEKGDGMENPYACGIAAAEFDMEWLLG